MTTETTRKFRPATQLVHAGSLRSGFAEMSEAMFLTQGFLYPDAEAAEARFKGENPGFIYSRYANPTTDMFEKRMCALEGAEEGRATASGMAAVAAAILCQVKAGDHVISARAVFGSCRYIVETLLPRYGVEISIIDGSDIANWKAAVRPNTKVMFLESPSNPTLEIIDIAAVAEVANEAGAKLIVDNVFATPLYQKPLELGAHIVVYSTTKHIDGQGRCLGGIVLSDREWVETELQDYYRHTGPGMSPFNAWIMLKGLETLSVRVRQMTQSAAAVADVLAGKPGVKRVLYPGRADHPQADVIAKQMTGGSTLIAPENGRSIMTIVRSSKNTSTDNSAVIIVCAGRLRVPKKKVKATVRIAPQNNTNQMTFGTVPSAAIKRARRALVMRSSWCKISVNSGVSPPCGNGAMSSDS